MSWQKVKLGQFLKNREGRYKPNDKAIQGLKRIDKINFSGTIFLSDKPSNTDMILVKKGDLIISGINVEKGAMNIYQGEEDVVATIHYSSYEFDEEKIDIDFLTNFLKSLEFKKALKEQVPGGIKTEIKPKHILPLIVDIPTDVEEQRRVVKKLIENNSIIENVTSELTHQLDLIKKLRQAFLREAMQGKLVKSTNIKETGQRLLEKIKAEKAQLIAEKKLKKEKELPPITEDEIPFEIPEHWAWCRFDNICEIKSNLVNPDKYLKFPHIAPNHIEKGTGKLLEYQTVEEDELISAKHYFYAGQLLYSKVRPKLNKIVKVDFEGLCSADMYPLKPLINSDYLLNCMLSQFFLDEVDKFDNRVKMPKINQKQLSQLPIPLPPLHEQEQIVTKLEELMSFCDGLEQSIKESNGYNEMLLEQVLREALQPKEEV